MPRAQVALETQVAVIVALAAIIVLGSVLRLVNPSGLAVLLPERCHLPGLRCQEAAATIAPRDVLNSIPGVKLTEMKRIREYAWCCGSGGGVGRSNPEFAQWTAQERIDEAETTGAEAIVTACPWCQKLFNKTINDGGSRMKVYDIVELFEQAIE